MARSLPVGSRSVAKPSLRMHSRLFPAQVIIVSGQTGCGKTTQTPQVSRSRTTTHDSVIARCRLWMRDVRLLRVGVQFILEDVVDNTAAGGHCKIVCTQPRRLAAIGDELGKSVGYQVRLRSLNAMAFALGATRHRVKDRQSNAVFVCTCFALIFLQFSPDSWRQARVGYDVPDVLHHWCTTAAAAGAFVATFTMLFAACPCSCPPCHAWGPVSWREHCIRGGDCCEVDQWIVPVTFPPLVSPTERRWRHHARHRGRGARAQCGHRLLAGGDW